MLHPTSTPAPELIARVRVTRREIGNCRIGVAMFHARTCDLGAIADGAVVTGAGART